MRWNAMRNELNAHATTSNDAGASEGRRGMAEEDRDEEGTTRAMVRGMTLEETGEGKRGTTTMRTRARDDAMDARAGREGGVGGARGVSNQVLDELGGECRRVWTRGGAGWVESGERGEDVVRARRRANARVARGGRV